MHGLGTDQKERKKFDLGLAGPEINKEEMGWAFLLFTGPSPKPKAQSKSAMDTRAPEPSRKSGESD